MSRAASGRRHTGEDAVLGRPDSTASSLPGDESSSARQAHLPPLRWLLQPDEYRFAHPAEIEFANLLSFYGIRWAYEPTTFALRDDGDGQRGEFVTPDFYLPDFDLYVELTTMRQRLVTRKNRKFRLLRERYPNIRVRMLYLRDFERLRETYRSAPDEREARLAATFLPAVDIEAHVAELADRLVQSWGCPKYDEGESRPLLLGIGSGSDRFLASLAGAVRGRGVAIDCCQTEITPYSGPAASPRARLTRPPALPVAGRTVVIVQEVLSTGLSAAFAESWLRRREAGSIAVCALLDREAARIVDVPVVAPGLPAPDRALGGFGLARWRAYRDLPFIAEIEAV